MGRELRGGISILGPNLTIPLFPLFVILSFFYYYSGAEDGQSQNGGHRLQR
jgi:hypothetical protein